MEKQTKEFNLKIIYLILAFIGVILTLIYIFKTSTSILTSDSVITDVLAHEQKINKQFFLKNWYYGNEFWFFSLSIPTLLLSFFMSNQILIRQISVLITAIIFFIILYRYGKKFLSKKDTWILITIFLSGISYSILDYFYAFNAYLTVVINSMLLLFMYFKSFEEKEKKKIYYILGIIFTFMFNMGSLRYIPSVVIPFILTECVFIFIDNQESKKLKDLIKKNSKVKKLFILVLVAVCGFCTYKFLTINLNFKNRASSTNYNEVEMESIQNGVNAIADCVFNFFGYDNKNHPNTFMMPSGYFLKQHKNFSIISFRGLSYLIKFVVSIIFMIITPITLFKNFKKNNRKIQFLIVFNMISWLMMIYCYLFTGDFFYNCSELKYFIFNIILNIILGIYCISKFYIKTPLINKLFQILFIFYIIANIYQTANIIVEHDQKTLDRRYELVNILEKNKLTFGYSSFWDGLITYYLSNYKITCVGVSLTGDIQADYWYSDRRWYQPNYHTGRTFLVMNSWEKSQKKFFKKTLGKPNKEIETKNYVIFIYDKNPLNNYFSRSKDLINV